MEVINNQITENVIGEGNGIRIINANGADEGRIRSLLLQNNVYQNNVGCRIVSLNSSGGNIYVKSYGNNFKNNDTGIAFWGGISINKYFPANNNIVDFSANGTVVQSNNGTLSLPNQSVPGGIIVFGGSNGWDNVLKIIFSNSTIYSNNGLDLNALGAGKTGGDFNDVQIHLNGLTNIPSIKLQSSGNNTVSIN